MMFAGYSVCGAGTKQDILYLRNVYANNFAIYFHLYDRLEQSRASGERHPGRDGCCLVLVIIHPGNAGQLERSFWNSHFCVHFRFFPETKHQTRVTGIVLLMKGASEEGTKSRIRLHLSNIQFLTVTVQCDPFSGEGRAGQRNLNVKIPKCSNNGCNKQHIVTNSSTEFVKSVINGLERFSSTFMRSRRKDLFKCEVGVVQVWAEGWQSKWH